jgi:hypothetical protein
MLAAIASIIFAGLAAIHLYRLVKAKRRQQMERMDDTFATYVLPGDDGRDATPEEIEEYQHTTWSDYWFQSEE